MGLYGNRSNGRKILQNDRPSRKEDWSGGSLEGAVAGSEKRPGPRGEFSSPVSGVAASALCLAGSQNFPQGVCGSWDPSKPLAARPDRCHGNSVARRRARAAGWEVRHGRGAGPEVCSLASATFRWVAAILPLRCSLRVGSLTSPPYRLSP